MLAETTTTTAAATAARPPVKPYTEETRAALAAYRDSTGLALSQLARELGINASHVSKYLAGKPECDVERLEATIEDVLKNAATRRVAREALFETAVSRSINAACELIRKTNDVGLIHGPAGLGKSCGVERYRADNPAALVVTLSRWNSDASGLASALCAQMEMRGKRAGMGRSEWLVERLRGSNRLIVIDNAHRMGRSALEWIFDFSDPVEAGGTGCPVALVGNPELLTKIALNDQQFSRIGVLRPLKVTDAKTLAESLLQRLCPVHASELLDLATKVTAERGHLRALKKHLLLMPEFIRVTQGDARKAFLMAHTQLVANYKLEE